MTSSVRGWFGSTLFFWLAIGIAGAFYLFTFEGGRLKLRDDRLKFGIDLRGGTYITLEVQTDKALEVELLDQVQVLQTSLEDQNLAEPEAHVVQGNEALLRFDNHKQALAAQDVASREFSIIDSSVDEETLKLSLKENVAKNIAVAAVLGNIDVLRTRLDNLGVGEIPIAAQDERNILIELPDVHDPQKAKAMIGKPALLEIKLVEKIGSSPEEILDEYDGDLPEGMIILPGKSEGYQKPYYLVPAYTDLTGRLLKDSFVGVGGRGAGGIAVNFIFKQEGGKKFYELTRKNINRQIAIIVDGIVVSAPKVDTPIGAQGSITGNFTTESAKELAMLLKSGAFVAPVTFAEERQIGPSLGAESIKKGVQACLVGLLLLFVFCVVWYKTSGLFAFCALIYNLLLILLMLSAIGATLTLPGIAGMVLTIGMAIDASILIYEKIKEELQTGVILKKAVQTGFSDAMEVILDSNITTFIVGIVLFKFGVGPIQGFALTMMIGIIATLITGLFFLRSIFTFLLENLGVQNIRI